MHARTRVPVALLALGFTALLCRAAGASTIIVGGNLPFQTWTLAGSPYIVQGDVTIPSGSSLTIEAGVVVQVASTDVQFSGIDPNRVEIKVNGNLVVSGTAADPVTFMAQKGTDPGIWYGIIVPSNAGSVALHNVSIEHANDGIATEAPAGIVSLDNVTLAVNSLDLGLFPGSGDPAISGTLRAGYVANGLTIPTGATLAPNRTSSVVSGGTFTLAAGATYRPTLSSVASYQQLQVVGGVALAGALDLDVASLVASIGQSFVLLDNQGSGPVSGQFDGLPEGALFDAGSCRFQISYVGGTGNDVVLTVVAPAPTSDLSLVKSAPAQAPLSGGGLDYGLAVSNAGPSTAPSVVVVDSLPSGLRYASAVPSQGTCSESGGRISCALGDIAAGGSASIAIHADFAFDTLVIVNTATVSSPNPDPSGGNNAASAETRVAIATTAVNGPGGPATGPALDARPNPFRGVSRVFFRAEPGSRAELAIYDAAGRRVRAITTTVQTRDGAVIEWDGRGDDGSPAGVGIYYYQVRVNGRVIGGEHSVLLR